MLAHAKKIPDGGKSTKGRKISRTPASLFIAITSRCNQACRHCAVYSDRFTHGPDLSTEEWLQFIEELARLKVMKVKISGGEPFVREDIFTILDSLHEKPLRLSINTNATLIDEEKARRLARYRSKLDDVMVSLEGGDAPTHDALRGQGAFDRGRRGIELLVRHVGRITAYCTVTKLNCRSLGSVARLAQDMGIMNITFNELLIEGRGHKFRKELSLDTQEIKQAVEDLKEIREESPFVSGTLLEMEEIFEGIRGAPPENPEEATPEDLYLSGCGALITECSIRPDGWAVPCDRLPELTAARILETPLDAIWREAPLFQEFRKRFTTPITDLDTCRGCAYAPRCTGGCPASSYIHYGTTMARDPQCCYKLFEEDKSRGAL
jgi:SynChlorMet cassette radical SAM/SPASM protein ScmE